MFVTTAADHSKIMEYPLSYTRALRTIMFGVNYMMHVHYKLKMSNLPYIILAMALRFKSLIKKPLFISTVYSWRTRSRDPIYEREYRT